MKRLLIGVVLVVAAAFIAVALKDYLDQKSPEYAVPHLTVTADTTEVRTHLSHYNWKFVSGKEIVVTDPMLEQLDQGRGVTGWDEGMVLSTTDLGGGERLNFSFSQKYAKIHIDRTDAYDYRFNPTDDDTTVPYEKGAYYYRVTAEFKQGRVEYYFRINVV